jgi:uncharacterized protein (TIGR02444 family)
VLTFDNPFWKFSLWVYAVPAVSAECLDLQRRFGIDINQLLYCAWMGSAHKTALSDQDIAAAEASVSAWHANVVRPLRVACESLKPMPAMSEPAVSGLRADIAGSELRAEEIKQAMLFAFAEALGGTGTITSAAEAVRHNVSVYLQRNAPPGENPALPENLVAQAMDYNA